MRISDWSSDVCSSYLDFLGLDLAGETVAPERVGNLVQALFRLFPGRFVRSLERRDISFEQIGHRARAGVGSDLDASPLLDHVGKVALEYRRSEEHTSELQSLMRIPYAVSCLKKTSIY